MRALPRAHHSDNTKIHEAEIEDYLGAKQPESVVVRTQAMEKKRREPESDQRRGSRVQAAQSQSAQKTVRASVTHDAPPPHQPMRPRGPKTECRVVC